MRQLLLPVAILTAAFGLRSVNPRTRQAASSASYREVVAVFITMAECCNVETPSLRSSLQLLKGRFKIQATREKSSFRSVGVGLDWDPDAAWTHLKQFAPFDEVAVGGNWYGLSAETAIWRDSTVLPMVPQLLVFEHQVTEDSDRRLHFGPRRLLHTQSGADAVAAWAVRCTQNIANPCY